MGKSFIEGSLVHITRTYKGEEDEQECDIYQIINDDGVGFFIDKETVGQFTGLHDQNGKEIYESDIVEIDKHVAKTFDIYSKGIINYLNGGFIVTKNDGSYATIKSALLILGDLNNIFRGKVIGNIYENPELLKGDDNNE